MKLDNCQNSPLYSGNCNICVRPDYYQFNSKDVDHIPIEPPIMVDRCLEPEIRMLRDVGITTVACCCGKHFDKGKDLAYIQVDSEEDVRGMESLGYIRIKETVKLAFEPMTFKIKPCPFCGHLTIPFLWGFNDGFAVECSNEDCLVQPCTQKLNCDSLEGAIKDWNEALEQQDIQKLDFNILWR